MLVVDEKVGGKGGRGQGGGGEVVCYSSGQVHRVGFRAFELNSNNELVNSYWTKFWYKVLIVNKISSVQSIFKG